MELVKKRSFQIMTIAVRAIEAWAARFRVETA
jgi:hypothetical protein